MTLRTSIPAALAAPLTRLVGELGVPCRVWYAEQGEATPDNAESTNWRLLSADTVSVVIGAMDERQRQKDWGSRVDATLSGLAMISPVIRSGYLVLPTEGFYCGRFLEVRATQPIEVGGVTTMALEEVPDPRN